MTRVPRTRDFYRQVYDILVEHAGCLPREEEPRMAESFLGYFTRGEEDPFEVDYGEFRFCGSLGFGGKLYLNGGRLYVSCYYEDRTPHRDEMIKRTNLAIGELIERFSAPGPSTVEKAP